jgi:hypothetical protein
VQTNLKQNLFNNWTPTKWSSKMTKINRFDSNNLDVIRDAIDSKLAEIGNEFGIVLSIGGMSYSATEVTTRLTVRTVNTDIKAGESIKEASERSEFSLYAKRFGLKAEDFGKVVTVDSKQFRIVGIKPKSRKFPILGEDVVSKTVYKLPVSAIKEQLSAA